MRPGVWLADGRWRPEPKARLRRHEPGLFRWLIPALLVVAWLGLGALGGPLLGKLSDVQTNDEMSFLPKGAEATAVSQLQKQFAVRSVLPAVVVYERRSGLTPDDRALIAGAGRSLAGLDDLADEIPPPIPSKDGEAAELIVPVSGVDGPKAGTTAQEIRKRVETASPAGLAVHVTGPGGYAADFSDAFGEIDGSLLRITALAVAVILILVYRSPLLPVIVLLSTGVALAGASLVIYPLAKKGVLTLSGQTQGILLILVFGAATDYALLLVARYREELARDQTVLQAMRAAWRRSFEPIAASAGTVMAGMLCMLFSRLNSNHWLGPVGAIGIAASMIASLTFLPPLLLLFGRAVFWPLRPRHHRHLKAGRGLYGRIASGVKRCPRAIWIVTVLVLIGGAAFAGQLHASGTPQRDIFLNKADAVVGQDALARHFPSDASSPAVIVASASSLTQLWLAAKQVPGVAELAALPGDPNDPTGAAPKVVDGKVELIATLRDPADSVPALATVRALRAAVHAVPGADAKVGGETANQIDAQSTAARDRRVIVPIVLVVIFLILMLLLRALLAALLLIATVVLSFGATLGVGALVFHRLLHFSGADPSVPLYAFVFLVALGIDYNIFLMTRVREEAKSLGTTYGTLRGLAVTGGVITSAGVVLAATFASLAVLPILFMVEVAFLVAFGVLLDTLVVRSLLVPALAVDIGRAIWWPSRLDSRRRKVTSGARVVATRATAEE